MRTQLAVCVRFLESTKWLQFFVAGIGGVRYQSYIQNSTDLWFAGVIACDARFYLHFF